MEISEFTRGLVEEYRKARADYLGGDTHVRPMDEIDEARERFYLAAKDLAASVLYDIDAAKGVS